MGKTSILQSIINKLLKKVNPNNIIYVPAELKEIKALFPKLRVYGIK